MNIRHNKKSRYAFCTSALLYITEKLFAVAVRIVRLPVPRVTAHIVNVLLSFPAEKFFCHPLAEMNREADKSVSELLKNAAEIIEKLDFSI